MKDFVHFKAVYKKVTFMKGNVFSEERNSAKFYGYNMRTRKSHNT